MGGKRVGQLAQFGMVGAIGRVACLADRHAGLPFPQHRCKHRVRARPIGHQRHKRGTRHLLPGRLRRRLHLQPRGECLRLECGRTIGDPRAQAGGLERREPGFGKPPVPASEGRLFCPCRGVSPVECLRAP